MCDELLEWQRDENDDDSDMEQVLKAASDAYKEYLTAAHVFPRLPTYSCTSPAPTLFRWISLAPLQVPSVDQVPCLTLPT